MQMTFVFLKEGKIQQRNRVLESLLGRNWAAAVTAGQSLARAMVSKGPVTGWDCSGVRNTWAALVPSPQNKDNREHLGWAGKQESIEKRATNGIAPKRCPFCSFCSYAVCLHWALWWPFLSNVSSFPLKRISWFALKTSLGASEVTYNVEKEPDFLCGKYDSWWSIATIYLRFLPELLHKNCFQER